MYAVIEINGGVGKNIMASAIISGIKNKYPERKILVITVYPAVFLNHPDVYRVFRYGYNPYFYEEYIHEKDVMFFCDEPYRSNGYMKKEKHLIEAWGDILNVDCDINPKIYLNKLEQSVILNNSSFNKPLMIFQPFGGSAEQKNCYSWNRDIPFRQAQLLANYFSEKYHVLQPVVDRHIKLDNCEHVNLPLRDLFVYIKHAQLVVGIDSLVQHARKSLGGQSLVFWVTNSPIVFGYEENINVLPSQEIKITNVNDSYLDRYDFSGSKTYDYPFEDDNIFDIDYVIQKYFEGK